MSTQKPLVLVAGQLQQLPVGDVLTTDSDRKMFGFLNQTETTLAFDNVDTFTLGSVGATWSYYRDGIKRTITGSKTVQVAAPMVNGAMYFIAIDSTDGTLASSTSPWTLLDSKLPVATLYWNATLTPKYVLSEERHTILIDRRVHYLHHFDIGTRMQSVGALTGYTINTDTNAAKTFAIAASVLMDEDIIEGIAPLTQPDGTATAYTVMYRTAVNTWAWKSSNMPFVYNVGNVNDFAQYDNNGTMTNASNNRWVNSYLVFTNVAGAMCQVIIPGRAQFTSLVLAQAEDPATFVNTGFPCAEYVIAYRLTWAVLSTNTSQGKCRLAAIPTRVTVAAINTSFSGVGTDHNTLAGLQGGAVDEYYHLTAAEYAALASLAGATVDMPLILSFAAAQG